MAKEVFFFCGCLETWFTVKHSHVRTDTWHGFPGHNLTNLSRMKKHESKRPSSTYLCVHVRKNLFVTFTLLSVSSQVIICTEVKHTVFDLRPPLQNNPLVTVTNTLNKSPPWFPFTNYRLCLPLSVVLFSYVYTFEEFFLFSVYWSEKINSII